MLRLDRAQREAVEQFGSRALVLAGPGCGKTHILAERVATARERHGVRFADMLCLTFTNRAARAMRDRIAARLGILPEGLYVGNIHRFCLRMLRSEGLISADTAVVDEDDAAEFIDRYAHGAGAGWRAEVQALATDRYMTAHDYPARLHRALWFTPGPHHLRCVEAYERFKRDHNLMDFDDCLLWAYDALRERSRELPRARYSWVQVDEVQDLTPLQMAIVSLLAPAPDATVLYLGDEQQAIFDFLGAGTRVLERVKTDCGGRILRLQRNYRSTAELTELCDTFAIEQLGIDPDFLPDVGAAPAPEGDCLTLWEATDATHKDAVAALARRMADEHPGETTAVLVRSNAGLAELSRVFAAHGITHMAVGLRDAFRRVAFKTVLAHMAVALSPLRTAEWARVLYATGTVRRLDDAAALVAEMREAAMTPADLLSPDGLSDVQRAVAAIDAGATLAPAQLDRLGRLVYPLRRADNLTAIFGGDVAAMQAALAPTLRARLAAQERLAEERDFDSLRGRLHARYGAIWAHTRDMLACDAAAPDNTLRAQLTAHLHELGSFNEGDLYDSGNAERVALMTVHKAKGLEMDNVIVANANAFHGSSLDRARIFYVAFSRARKRLAVVYSSALTPALECIAPLMTAVPRQAVAAMAAEERVREFGA